MRALFVCALLLFISGSILFVSGQEPGQGEKGKAQASESKATNDQIEVKADRFSGVTTVKMKPQVILDNPDHHLTIRSEAKLGDKKSAEYELGSVSAQIWLDSHYNKSIDYGDRELHLLIDGKSLDLGKLPSGVRSESNHKPSFKLMASFVSILDRSGMEQISKGNRIEMRLGGIELTLNQSVTATLKAYANQVLNTDKSSRGRKP
jgi:hypothetical protein